jgi:hypothetical protein
MKICIKHGRLLKIKITEVSGGLPVVLEYPVSPTRDDSPFKGLGLCM